MRGPKPKPTALHVLEGTFVQSRHGDRAAEPRPTGHPEPPAWLTGHALEFWRRVVPEMIELGVVKRIDADALALMADTFGRWRTLRESVGDSVADQLEATYQLSRLQNDWRNLAATFGLTPSDRTRLEIAEGGPTDAVEGLIA